jgi:hypothetical protein
MTKTTRKTIEEYACHANQSAKARKVKIKNRINIFPTEVVWIECDNQAAKTEVLLSQL